MPASSTTRRSCISPQRPRTSGRAQRPHEILRLAAQPLLLLVELLQQRRDLALRVQAIAIAFAELLIDLRERVADRLRSARRAPAGACRSRRARPSGRCRASDRRASGTRRCSRAACAPASASNDVLSCPCARRRAARAARGRRAAGAPARSRRRALSSRRHCRLRSTRERPAIWQSPIRKRQRKPGGRNISEREGSRGVMCHVGRAGTLCRGHLVAVEVHSLLGLAARRRGAPSAWAAACAAASARDWPCGRRTPP